MEGEKRRLAKTESQRKSERERTRERQREKKTERERESAGETPSSNMKVFQDMISQTYRGTLLMRTFPPLLGQPYGPMHSPSEGTRGGLFIVSEVPL